MRRKLGDGRATWDIGVLTDNEYEALITALAYYTDAETLGDPEPGETMDAARALLGRLELPPVHAGE